MGSTEVHVKQLCIFAVASFALVGCGGLVGGNGNGPAAFTTDPQYIRIETLIYENNFEQYQSDADMNNPSTGWKYETLDPALATGIADVVNPVRLGKTDSKLAAHDGSQYGVFYPLPYIQGRQSYREFQDMSQHLPVLAPGEFDEMIYEMWVNMDEYACGLICIYSDKYPEDKRYSYIDGGPYRPDSLSDPPVHGYAHVAINDRGSFYYLGTPWHAGWNKIQIKFDISKYTFQDLFDSTVYLVINDSAYIVATSFVNTALESAHTAPPYYIAGRFSVTRNASYPPVRIDGIRVLGVTKVRKG